METNSSSSVTSQVARRVQQSVSMSQAEKMKLLAIGRDEIGTSNLSAAFRYLLHYYEKDKAAREQRGSS